MHLKIVPKVAPTDSTILISGPTGTGKTHLAEEIHRASKRRNSRFLSINLATLNANLIESELFGHERGAFSGANHRRIGKLEAANGGTVLLDEIGELPLPLQTRLLEALNSKTISPVGSNREVKLDIRIIAATNRNLPQMVREGSFREDLYYRINTFQLDLPPLRKCASSILPLAHGFLAALGKGNAWELSPAFSEALQRYPWPGNLRELKNTIEYSLVMANGQQLLPEDLPASVRAYEPTPAADLDYLFPEVYHDAKAYFERAYLEQVLRKHGGRINVTARHTRMSKVTLIDKVKRYQIDTGRFKYAAYREETLTA